MFSRRGDENDTQTVELVHDLQKMFDAPRDSVELDNWRPFL